MPPPPTAPNSIVQDAGTWKFAAGLIIGFCVRTLTSKLNLKPAVKPAAPVKKRAAVPRSTEELKMVLCVNNGLGMGKGKIGAQCAHAATGVVQHYQRKQEVLFRQWEMLGQAKVALKCTDSGELEQLESLALQAGLPCYLVHDAGRTQIPAGSQTVLAIGPGPKSKIDQLTGHLKLL